MRRVPLKIVDFCGPNGEPLPRLHYSEALVLIAKLPQQGAGISAEEMTSPLAIADAIKIACDQTPSAREVFLEEADWGWLVAKLKANQFPFVSQVFKTMVDDVGAAAKINPNQLNGRAAGGRDDAPAPAIAAAAESEREAAC